MRATTHAGLRSPLDERWGSGQDDKALRVEIKNIDRGCPEEDKFNRYCGLRNHAVEKILLDNFRDTRVHCLVREATPFRKFSLPINRFIVSQIVAMQNCSEFRKRLGYACSKPIELIQQIQLLDVEPTGKRYRVTYAQEGVQNSILCDNAIIRFGAKRDEVRPEQDEAKFATEGLLSSIGRALAIDTKREMILNALWQHRDALNAAAKASSSAEENPHTRCGMPHWDPRSSFVQQLQAFDPRRPVKEAEKPIFRARFVKGFPPNGTRDYTVYRIKAELEGLPALQGTLRVTYDLHPEDGRPISRVAFGPKHEIWLNTNSNYKVRARTNDGREWDLGWVHDALKSGGSTANVKLDGDGEELFKAALGNVRTTRKEKDRKRVCEKL